MSLLSPKIKHRARKTSFLESRREIRYRRVETVNRCWLNENDISDSSIEPEFS